MSYVTRTDMTPEPAPKKPFFFHFGNRKSLIETLAHLGFSVPDSVTALAAANQPLGGSGHTIDLYQLDQLLAGYDV